jgi:hypothetical protein
MTLDEIQAHVRTYITTNRNCEAIFVRATTSTIGAENIRSFLGASDPFTCATMLMAVIEGIIGLCEHNKDFYAEQCFIRVRGACATILDLDPDHPSETRTLSEPSK